MAYDTKIACNSSLSVEDILRLVLLKNGSNYSLGVAPVSSYDADAQLYFDNVATQPSATQKGYINTLVLALKAANIFTELDRLWILAQEVEDNSYVSLVNPTSTDLSWTVKPTWTQYQGFAGNASTMFLKTGYIPSVDGVNYTLNDANIGVYSRTNVAGTSTDMGCATAATVRALRIQANRSSNDLIGTINASALENVSDSVPDGLATSSISRPNGTEVNGYLRGVLTDSSPNASTVGASVPNVEVYICGSNNNGSLVNPSSNQLAVAWIGSDGYSQLDMYNALQAYMTSLGTQV
jgi:hypothetical protein